MWSVSGGDGYKDAGLNGKFVLIKYPSSYIFIIHFPLVGRKANIKDKSLKSNIKGTGAIVQCFFK